MKVRVYTVYQPIIEIRTGRTLGYEALTRGTGKFRSPEVLFRKAFEKGATAELDFKCLRSALRILPRMKRKHLLFVNVEPFTMSRSFTKGREGYLLLKRISAYGRQIVFELTEGMKGRDFGLIEKGIRLLKKFHCQFAIDDVTGVGVKLFRLLSLKPHFIKIDMSLIKGIRRNRFHRDLVKRIIALGRMTSSRIIAEGLERKRDVDLVQKMGIPYVQGFYFSRPKRSLS